MLVRSLFDGPLAPTSFFPWALDPWHLICWLACHFARIWFGSLASFWARFSFGFAFTRLYMYVVGLLPYYFGTVYRPTLNLLVSLKNLSRKLQPVAFHGGYLNYQARDSRKGLLNQHSQRPHLFWLQRYSSITCTHDICWSDLCLMAPWHLHPFSLGPLTLGTLSVG